MRPIVRVLFVIVLFTLSLSAAQACTVFTKAGDGAVLVGNNEDWHFNAPCTVKFVPAVKNQRGRVCFALYGVVQGGLNDRGFCFDMATCPGLKPSHNPEKPSLGYDFYDRLLAECGSVEEALAFFDRYNLPGSHEDHFLLIDRSGASAVVEWRDGRQVVFRKEGSYQVITNFALSDHKLGWYPCPRYDAATEMLKKDGLSMKSMASILEATAQSWGGGGTNYSNVYDLTNLVVQVYYKADFNRAVTLNLQDELAKGPRTIRMEDLFRQ